MRVSFDPNAAAVHDGIYGLPFSPEEARVVLVPVPWEATVSYGAGTANGPAAILAASRQVDLLDRETGKPYEAGIAMLEIPTAVRAWSDEARRLALPVIENGGPGEDPALRDAVARVDGLGDRMNAWVHETTRRLLAEDKLVGIVGGDHSVPLGAMRALAERRPGLGVLHVDAHADLRDAYEGFRFSHASIMFNVLRDLDGVSRLVQVGVRDYGEAEDQLIRTSGERVRTFFEADLRRALLDGEAWSRIAGRIVAELPREVYVSFDIDGLDPALCPHTGTPVVSGLSFAEATGLLRTIVESGRRIVGFDLTEVAPDPDGQSEWDGNVGARVLYKEIGFALLSQRA
ncbi:MAG TPA: agmatinase family protein [Vicinamibacteria bacterium]|nr:agmatinase family protein [Vicinamibacteria bacterium]